MRISILVAILLSGTAPVVANPVSSPSPIAVAVADTAHRDADNVKLDAGRKPAELLQFLGLRRGMKVGDPFGGNLYWAEITSRVVGPTGHVTIWQPAQFYDDKAKARFAAFAPTHPNVTEISSPFGAPELPRNAFDFMLINLDYHDVYWTNEKRGITRMEPAEWLKAINASIKPGGIVGVVDHVGPAGDTRAIVEKEHRIDPAVVRRDFERAGFALVGSSKLLANPADDHSLLVFDPAIRGKTDRFIYKFRKVR